MGHEIDLSKYSVRTDLAIDLIEKNNIKGILSETEEIDGILVTDVTVLEEGSLLINKKKGRYITIEFDDITDYNNGKVAESVFTKQLNKVINSLNLKKEAKCLIIGLGNSKSTPDALGPLTINDILVTSHLFELGSVEEGFRDVSAITPGVMGQTGIETSEIIKGVVEKVLPDFVICIDALASQSLERVNKTIQMTDTGIHPGSGVGNNRGELSFQTLNIPVIAIGVPTVVDAITIVSDTFTYMHKHYSYSKENIDKPVQKLFISKPNYLKKQFKLEKKDKEKLLGIVGTLENYEVKQLLYEVLSPIGYNLIVTPKEVDFVIEKLSSVIGKGINKSLHEKC